MAVDNRPFPLDVVAWKTDLFVRGLDPATRAVYMDLLLISWREVGLAQAWISKPVGLLALTGVGHKRFETMWRTLSAKFELRENGRLHNPKIEQTRAELDAREGKTKKIVVGKTAKTAEPVASTRARTRSLFSSSSEESETERDQKEESPRTQLIAYFSERWIAEIRPADGRPPRLSKGDVFAMGRLVTDFGLEEARRLVDRYLRDRDPFVVKSGHNASLIATRLNAYRSTAAPEKASGERRPRSRTIDEIERYEAELRERLDRGEAP